MSILDFWTNNKQFFILLLIGTGGGSGLIGWILASKSRKIDFQTKVFQMNSEMLDGIKADFDDRIKYFKEINNELETIVKEQHQYIKSLKKELAIYKKKYGKLDDNQISNIST